MSRGQRPLRVVVVDDEQPARAILAKLLAADPEIELAAECRSGEEAVAAIRDLAPDLVFLDVQMPGLDGFGVLAELAPEELPAVVFVTAYDHYAVQAFEVHALDYLLKPFDDERFAEALGRAKRTIRRNQVEALSRRLVGLLEEGAADRGGRQERYLERLMIRSGGRVVFVRAEEIDWIEAQDYYVRVHAGKKRHLLRETLAALEEKLDPERFVRVHRSAIVNLDRVREMQPAFKGNWVLLLEDGTRLRIARQRRADLERRLGGRG